MAIELSREHGIPLFMGFGRVMKGWSLSLGAGAEAGIAEIHAGLSDLKATGTGLGGSACSRCSRILGVVVAAKLAILTPRRDFAAQESHFGHRATWPGEIPLDLTPPATWPNACCGTRTRRAPRHPLSSCERAWLARLLARDEGEAGRASAACISAS
jgi:hypothetical protein